jgi:hypothetical protein
MTYNLHGKVPVWEGDKGKDWEHQKIKLRDWSRVKHLKDNKQGLHEHPRRYFALRACWEACTFAHDMHTSVLNITKGCNADWQFIPALHGLLRSYPATCSLHPVLLAYLLP